MTTIQYKEIQYNGHYQVEIIDEQLALDLEHFAEACGQSTDWVLKLIDYDILQIKVDPQSYQFMHQFFSRI